MRWHVIFIDGGEERDVLQEFEAPDLESAKCMAHKLFAHYNSDTGRDYDSADQLPEVLVCEKPKVMFKVDVVSPWREKRAAYEKREAANQNQRDLAELARLKKLYEGK